MRTKFANLVAAGLLAVGSGNASAVLISLSPDSAMVAVGTPLMVDVNISGLVAGGAPSLSVFDIDVLFDTALLMPTTVAYGGELDQGIFGSLPFPPINFPGGLNIAELSLEFPATLDSSQPAAFTLATITFDPLANGQVGLDFFINSLGDSQGDPLPIDAPPSAVPEPGTMLLLMLSLIGFLSSTRRWVAGQTARVA